MLWFFRLAILLAPAFIIIFLNRYFGGEPANAWIVATSVAFVVGYLVGRDSVPVRELINAVNKVASRNA